MKISRLIILCIIIIFTVFLTACWDLLEIENRSFVLSIGIDKADETESEDGGSDSGSEGSESGESKSGGKEEEKAKDEGKSNSKEKESDEKNKYKITFVNPDTAESEEGKVLDFVTYDTEAPSYTTGTIKLLQRFSKDHNFEHTKVIFFGRSLLEDEELVKNTVDILGRWRHLHSSMLMYMAIDKAADVFKVKPKTKTLLADYVEGIAEHSNEAARIVRVTFRDFARQIITTEGHAALPIIIPNKDEVKSTGMGIIKDYKLIGELDEKETIAYIWCNDRAKGGVLECKSSGCSIPFIYRYFKRKIKLDKVEGDTVYLTFNMVTDGAIEEYTIGKKLLDDEKLKSIEEELENDIVEQSMALIKRMQEEFKVDLLGVKEYLSKYHPKLHKKVSEDYEDFFQNKLKIKVEAKLRVRRIGKTV